MASLSFFSFYSTNQDLTLISMWILYMFIKIWPPPHEGMGVVVLAISFNRIFYCPQEINIARMWMYLLTNGGAMWVV